MKELITDLKKSEFLLTDEEAFYLGMDLSEGGGKPCDTTDSIRAGAEAELKKLVGWLKKHNNCPVLHEGRAFTLMLKDWNRLQKAVEK